MKKTFTIALVLLAALTSCKKDKTPTPQDNIKHGYVLVGSEYNAAEKKTYTNIYLNGTALDTKLPGYPQDVYYDAEGNYWICGRSGDGRNRVFKNDEMIYDAEENLTGVFNFRGIMTIDGKAYVSANDKGSNCFFVLIVDDKEETVVKLPETLGFIFDMQACNDRIYFLGYEEGADYEFNLYSSKTDISDFKKECTIVSRTSFNKIAGIPEDTYLDCVQTSTLTMKSPTDFYVSFSVESNHQYAFTYHKGAITILGSSDENEDRAITGACMIKGDYYVSTYYSGGAGEIYKNGSRVYANDTYSIEIASDGTNLYAVLAWYDAVATTVRTSLYKNGEITQLEPDKYDKPCISGM